MKTNRRVALLFISVLGSFVLLFLVLSFGNATRVVYGDSINGSLPVDFDLTPGEEKSAYPGEVVTYTHTLTNTSGVSALFTVTISSSSGWATLPQPNPFTRILDVSGTSQIEVAVSVPDKAIENSQDILTVTVQSTNDLFSAVNTTTVRHHKIFLPAVINSARWEKVGGSNVTGRSLAVCATNPNIILAGTIDESVHIYNGASWTPAASVPSGKSVTGLVMNQTCDRAYASLYDGGVWQGVYSGSSWAWTRLGNDDVLAARSLALTGDHLFAAGDFGIRYWNVNGGSSWLTTNIVAGNQPIMYLSAAEPANSNSALYAVQWQNGKIYRAFGNTPGTWSQLNLPDVPNVEMRSVFGNAAEVRFVGTQSGSYQLNGNAWVLSVPAGLRAGVVTDTAAYLGYAGNAGVYKVQGSTPTPLNAGWSTPPEFVYDLVLVGDKLYAATTTGVWEYSLP